MLPHPRIAQIFRQVRRDQMPTAARWRGPVRQRLTAVDQVIAAGDRLPPYRPAATRHGTKPQAGKAMAKPQYSW